MSRKAFVENTLVNPKPMPPKASWWAGLDRATFARTARREAERMNRQVLPAAAGNTLDSAHVERTRPA